MATSRHQGQDLTIVLLGNYGVGKSASGNTILGRQAFQSKGSFRPTTTKINNQTGTVFGKIISVYDTPGILGHEVMITSQVHDVLQSSRPYLFLVVVSVGRFTAEQEKAVRVTMEVLGENGLKRSILLFTNGAALGRMSLKDYISQGRGGSLPGIVEDFHGNIHLFENENRGQNQVRELLEKLRHLPPYSRGFPFTDFGPAVERRVVLLGLSRAGKSSTANTILGPDQFESVSRSARVEGRQLTVVDTPGFTSECLSLGKLFDEIMKSSMEADPGPHAFIIVVPLDRLTQIHIRIFELFGRDALKYVMFLFTHGDQLSGRSMESRIWANKDLRKLVTKCGHRFCVFDNTRRANREQVRNLLDMIDKMVTANNGVHYTSEMFSDIQSFTVKLSIKWYKIKAWFTRRLNAMKFNAARKARTRGRGSNEEAQGLLEMK